MLPAQLAASTHPYRAQLSCSLGVRQGVLQQGSYEKQRTLLSHFSASKSADGKVVAKPSSHAPAALLHAGRYKTVANQVWST